jgi:hypothetical protein
VAARGIWLSASPTNAACCSAPPECGRQYSLAAIALDLYVTQPQWLVLASSLRGAKRAAGLVWSGVRVSSSRNGSWHSHTAPARSPVQAKVTCIHSCASAVGIRPMAPRLHPLGARVPASSTVMAGRRRVFPARGDAPDSLGSAISVLRWPARNPNICDSFTIHTQPQHRGVRLHIRLSCLFLAHALRHVLLAGLAHQGESSRGRTKHPIDSVAARQWAIHAYHPSRRLPDVRLGDLSGVSMGSGGMASPPGACLCHVLTYPSRPAIEGRSTCSCEPL